MNRRQYLITVGSITVASLAGCSENGGSIGGLDEEEVKNEAKSPSWDDLYRNISDWEGEPVHYSNVQISDIQDDNGSFNFLIEQSDSNFIFCTWDGDPFKKDDNVNIWGVVKGTHTYTNTVGAEETVPEIELVDIQLVED